MVLEPIRWASGDPAKHGLEGSLPSKEDYICSFFSLSSGDEVEGWSGWTDAGKLAEELSMVSEGTKSVGEAGLVGAMLPELMDCAVVSNPPPPIP